MSRVPSNGVELAGQVMFAGVGGDGVLPHQSQSQILLGHAPYPHSLACPSRFSGVGGVTILFYDELRSIRRIHDPHSTKPTSLVLTCAVTLEET